MTNWAGARRLTDVERAAMIGEAVTWERTPWVHSGAVRGVGVDCGRLLVECVAAAVPGTQRQLDDYPQDWMHHRDDSDMVRRAAKYGRLMPFDPLHPPAPGDVLLMHYGRCISHCALVVKWPCIIHAYAPAGAVVLDDATHHAWRIKKVLEVMTWAA